jgi:hypothetical protein
MKASGAWNLLRYIDLEKWAGVGILVWVPKERTIYAAYFDGAGVLRAWHQGTGADDVIEGATQWRTMPKGPKRVR